MRTSQLTNLVLFISILTVSSCDKKSEIENQAPTCSITNPGNGVEIIQGQTVILSVEAIDSDGSVIDVIFSIDGHGIGISDTSPFHFDWNTTGVDTGRHTIKVTATDNEGSTATDEIVLFVIEEEEIGPPPLAAFTAGQTSVYLGSPIQFTDESTNDATSWNWEFGDGNTSSSQNPSHLYDATGTYTVSLTVANNFGSDTLTELNYITVSVRVGASDILRDVRDGQIYKTIEIGGQVWMAENLNYEASSGSWVYDNDSSNASSFGRLYNWEPAIEVCPFGWHLPTDNEWKQLENAIGMSLEDVHNTGWRGTEEGSKLKANNGWNSNGNGTDEYGFNALPGGYRYNNGNFGHMDSYAFFWSSTSYAADYAYYRAFHYTIDKIDRFPFPKDYGFSIRCVRDF